jgi:hypothetical protein
MPASAVPPELNRSARRRWPHVAVPAERYRGFRGFWPSTVGLPGVEKTCKLEVLIPFPGISLFMGTVNR